MYKVSKKSKIPRNPKKSKKNQKNQKKCRVNVLKSPPSLDRASAPSRSRSTTMINRSLARGQPPWRRRRDSTHSLPQSVPSPRNQKRNPRPKRRRDPQIRQRCPKKAASCHLAMRQNPRRPLPRPERERALPA